MVYWKQGSLLRNKKYLTEDGTKAGNFTSIPPSALPGI